MTRRLSVGLDHPDNPVSGPAGEECPKALVRASHVKGQVQGVGYWIERSMQWI